MPIHRINSVSDLGEAVWAVRKASKVTGRCGWWRGGESHHAERDKKGDLVATDGKTQNDVMGWPQASPLDGRDRTRPTAEWLTLV